MDILEEIVGLRAAAQNAGINPRMLLVPWQRSKELVELGRAKRNEGKLILPSGMMTKGEDVGIATIMGMQIQLSLGNKLYVTN